MSGTPDLWQRAVEVATVGAAIFGLYTVVQSALNRRVAERRMVLRDNPEALREAVARLASRDPMERYRGWLARALALLDRHLGRGPLLLHWRGLGWAFALSLLYVQVFLFATLLGTGGWVPLFRLDPGVRLDAIGGPGEAGWIALSLLSWMALLVLVGMHFAWISEAPNRLLCRLLEPMLGRPPPGWLIHLGSGVPAALVAWLAVTSLPWVPPLVELAWAAFVLWFNVPFAAAFSVLSAVSFRLPHAAVLPPILLGPAALGLFILALAFGARSLPEGERRHVLPTLGIVVAILAALTVALTPLHPLTGGRLHFLFVALSALLPIGNALLDWISMAISRALAERLLRRLTPGGRVPWGSLLAHLLADIAAAIGLLLLLALVLPLALHAHPGFENFWDSLALPGLPPIAVAEYACDSARDPFGAGLWATLMLASTLVPTVLHVTLVLASPLILWLSLRGALRRLLAQIPPDGPIPAALAAEGSLPHAITAYEQRQQVAAVTGGVVLATLAVAAVTWAMYRGLEAAAEVLLGLPQAGGAQLVLWFASGFDRAAVVACFAGH